MSKFIRNNSKRSCHSSKISANNAMIRVIARTQVNNITVEQLADYSGLSTVSKAGNKSISRAVRAIGMLAKTGFIECGKVAAR